MSTFGFLTTFGTQDVRRRTRRFRAVLEHSSTVGVICDIDEDLGLVRAGAAVGVRCPPTGFSSVESGSGEPLPPQLFEQLWARNTTSLGNAVGAFVAGAYRPCDRSILILRDHFGQLPCYYVHLPGRLFAASSTMAALLALEGVSSDLDEGEMVRRLVNDHGHLEASPYRSIRRLPPASLLRLERDRVSIQRYWEPPARLMDDYDEVASAETFRSLLDASVGRSLRGCRSPASQLSGGMDSSAVTILAAQRSTQPITTISNRYPVVETCDEGRYIEAVTRSVHSKHVERPADDVGPLAAFESSAKDWPGPTVGGNFYLVERMFDIAKSCHIDVMLDGFDGDTVVSHGWQRFAELALDGRWTELGVEALAIERRGGPSFLDIQRSFTYPALSKMVRNGHVLAAIGGLHTLARDSQRYSALGLGRDAFRRHRASRSATGGTDWMEYLRPDAVRRYQPTAIEPDPLQSALDRHRADIMMPFWSTALEALHHMGERAGVENRHPFLDRQLVEFCVALPASAKLRDGWTRRILRDALRDDYPPEIRQRTDKANLTPAFLHGLVEFDRPRVEHYLGRPLERLGALVEVERVRTAARAITGGAGTSGVEAMKVWTVLSAAVWMDANDRDLS